MAKSKQLKKQWYKIVAPKVFRNMELGETSVFEPSAMVGKNISVNLMNLTNNARNQNIKINFEVTKVHENKGETAITGYTLVNASLKRMVRRNIEKIDDSFVCETADNVKLRIKPLVIARRPTSGSVSTAIRNSAQAEIIKQAKAAKYDAFTADVIYHKVQDSLKKQLSKIYPVKMVEIKDMRVLQSEGAAQKTETVEPESAEEPVAAE